MLGERETARSGQLGSEAKALLLDQLQDQSITDHLTTHSYSCAERSFGWLKFRTSVLTENDGEDRIFPPTMASNRCPISVQ